MRDLYGLMILKEQRVTPRQLVAFAIGDLGIQVPFMSTVVFLMFFYTEVVGLSAATAGMIFMFASVWDAVTDPPMGWITERTRTRWGQCRPYFLFGSAPLAIAIALVYYKPPLDGTALVAYLLAAHMLFRTCFTAVGIPYAAYSARMTRDSGVRSTIAGLKLFFTIGAGALVAYAMLPLAHYFGDGDLAGGFFQAALILAIAPLVFLPITFFGTREQPEPAGGHPRVRVTESLATLKRNTAFWIVLTCIACVISAQVSFGSVSLYYFKYYLQDEGAAPMSLALSMGVGLLVTPLWVMLERVVGKKAAWMTGSAGAVGVLVYFAVAEVASSVEYTTICVLLNASLYGLTVTMWSMLPDTVEYGEWRSGVRVESMSFGFSLFALKVAMGLATAALGAVLTAIGFTTGTAQSVETLASLKLLAAVLPFCFVAFSTAAVAFYPMRKGDHQRIVRVLGRISAQASRSGQPDPQSHTPAARRHSQAAPARLADSV